MSLSDITGSRHPPSIKGGGREDCCRSLVDQRPTVVLLVPKTECSCMQLQFHVQVECHERHASLGGCHQAHRPLENGDAQATAELCARGRTSFIDWVGLGVVLEIGLEISLGQKVNA